MVLGGGLGSTPPINTQLLGPTFYRKISLASNASIPVSQYLGVVLVDQHWFSLTIDNILGFDYVDGDARLGLSYSNGSIVSNKG